MVNNMKLKFIQEQIKRRVNLLKITLKHVVAREPIKAHMVCVMRKQFHSHAMCEDKVELMTLGVFGVSACASKSYNTSELHKLDTIAREIGNYSIVRLQSQYVQENPHVKYVRTNQASVRVNMKQFGWTDNIFIAWYRVDNGKINRKELFVGFKAEGKTHKQYILERNIIGGATVKIAEFNTKDELINYIESNDK